MKCKEVIIAVVLMCSVLFAETSVTKRNITWTFDRDYPVGQFITGDYYVIGNPVKIVSITPASIAGRNGSMLNPDRPEYGHSQGFDSRIAANNYDNNVAESLPLTIPAGNSLVSSESHPDGVGRSWKLYVNSFEILTVLAEEPPVNSFRPPFAGTDKTIPGTLDGVALGKLLSLEPTENEPDKQVVAALFERPWIDLRGDMVYLKAVEGMEAYGREIARDVGIAALCVNLDWTEAEKKPIVIGLIQYGIDLYTTVQKNPTNFIADAGHGSGRKFPILFAEYMLGVDFDIEGIELGEDGQTFRVKESDVYSQPYELKAEFLGSDKGTVSVVKGSPIVMGNGTDWTTIYSRYDDEFGVAGDDQAYSITGRAYQIDAVHSDTWITLKEPYTGESGSNKNYKIANFVYYGHGNPAKDEELIEFIPDDINDYAWGITYGRHPERGSPEMDSAYQTCCTVLSWQGYALAAEIMDLETAWGHKPFFKYVKKYTDFYGGTGTYQHPRQMDIFSMKMYDRYHSLYSGDNPVEPVEPNDPPVIDVNSSVIFEDDKIRFIVEYK